eukprot:1139990-Pelagomonas_calceolata.AAC.6
MKVLAPHGKGLQQGVTEGFRQLGSACWGPSVTSDCEAATAGDQVLPVIVRQRLLGTKCYQ